MSVEINWEDYRKEFPATRDILYFNNAAISPLSTRVSKAISEVTGLFVAKGMLCEKEVFSRVASFRASVARLIGASSEEIAFTRNTTHAVLLAANSVKWEKGDNIVLPSIEFPANVYPWMGLIERGVELRMVDPDEDGLVTAEMLRAVCDKRTRVVTASYVQFSTGQRLDCAALGAFCRNRGILFHVDAIQAVGALEVDVERDMVDMLSCGGHKWMTATPGIGLFYCRRDLIGRLGIPFPGWIGVVDPWNFLDYDFTYRDDAGRHEEGSTNFQGVFALGTAAERFIEIGPGRVEQRILGLTGSLAEGLRKRGHKITSPTEERYRSGILCFKDKDDRTRELFEHLGDNTVLCSLREGSIRLSPHFFNDDTDIERFFKIMEVF